MAPRTMEIYLQEVQATVFFPSLPSLLKEKILKLALSFPELLHKMQQLKTIQVPPTAWFEFFQRTSDGKIGKSTKEEGQGSKRSNWQQSKMHGKVEKK